MDNYQELTNELLKYMNEAIDVLEEIKNTSKDPKLRKRASLLLLKYKDRVEKLNKKAVLLNGTKGQTKEEKQS